MPRYKGHNRLEENEEINIEHVTFNATHPTRDGGGRSTSRPLDPRAFSSQNVRPGQYESSEERNRERPVTRWPSPSDFQSEIVTETQSGVGNHRGNVYTSYPPPPLRHKDPMPNIATTFNSYSGSRFTNFAPGVVEDLHREIREGRLEQTVPPGVEYRLLPSQTRDRSHPRHGVQNPPKRPERKDWLPNNETRPVPPRPSVASRTSSLTGPGTYPLMSSSQPDRTDKNTKKPRSNSFKDRFIGGIDTLKAAGLHVKDVFSPSSKNQGSSPLHRRDSTSSDMSFACQGESEEMANRKERETNARAVEAFQADKYQHKKAPQRALKVEAHDEPISPSQLFSSPKVCKECKMALVQGMQTLCYTCESRLKAPKPIPAITRAPRTGQPLPPRACAECRISLVKGMRILCYPCERRLKTLRPVPAITREHTNLGDLPSDYLELVERDPPTSPVSRLTPTGFLVENHEVRPLIRAPHPPLKDNYLTEWEVEIKPTPPLKELKYIQYAHKRSVPEAVSTKPRVNTSTAERFGEEDVLFEPYRRRQTLEQRDSFDSDQGDGDGWDSFFYGSEDEGFLRTSTVRTSREEVVGKESRI